MAEPNGLKLTHNIRVGPGIVLFYRRWFPTHHRDRLYDIKFTLAFSMQIVVGSSKFVSASVRASVRPFLSDDSKCSCGHRNEKPYHFFFECPKYDNERSITINHLSTTLINLNLFLHGDRNLSIASNSEIVTTVLTFIALSKRFA